jgi:hypothetical protein
MASLNTEFTSEGHQPIAFGPVPVADYQLMVVSSDVKATNKGDGSYASLDIVVVEGQYEGRHIFQNVTLENPNEKAVEIGRRQLADLCRAVGKLRISDTSELHDVPFYARVGIEKGKDGYDDKNKINQFYPAGQTGPAPVGKGSAPAAGTKAPAWKSGGGSSAPATAPAATAGATAVGGGGKPPWVRK